MYKPGTLIITFNLSNSLTKFTSHTKFPDTIKPARTLSLGSSEFDFKVRKILTGIELIFRLLTCNNCLQRRKRENF